MDSSSQRDNVKVGVLSLHNSKETKAILNSVEDLGHDPEWIRNENTVVRVKSDEIEIEPDVDVVANRLLASNTDQPCESLGLADVYDDVVPMLNSPGSVLTAIHKFSTATTLASKGIPVPDALLALDHSKINEHRSEFGEEAVYKTAIGTHGGGTWKVSLDEDLNPKVGNRQAFLQSLIEEKDVRHHDLRVYVVGDEVIGAMNRYAPEGDWRTNVALGGSVEGASDSIPQRVRRIAKESAKAVGLDYAGIDIVKGEDEWYVLEVNPTAGFKGFYKATGVSPAPYIAKLAIEKAGGEVDDEEVEKLSGVLDDSVPSCKPEQTVSKSDEPMVIGYTDSVTVSGTSGTETVIAKSDTGAARTSIDISLAARIGAGPIKSIAKVKSGSSKSSKSRPVVDLVVGIGGDWHTVTASVEDRKHMNYPVLLGRDILQDYHVDVTKRAEDEEEKELEEE